MFSRQSYWCIVDTLKEAGFHTWPYHVYVPSFGEWGFTLAGQFVAAANLAAGRVAIPDRLRRSRNSSISLST